MEPKRVPNRAAEATRAENGEIIKLAHNTKDFNDLWGPRASLWRLKWGQNQFRIASSTLRASESLLEASWKGLGGLQARKNVFLKGSWAVLQKFQDRLQFNNIFWSCLKQVICIIEGCCKSTEGDQKIYAKLNIDLALHLFVNAFSALWSSNYPCHS